MKPCRLIILYRQQSPFTNQEISTELPQFPWVTICSDEPLDPLVVHKIDYYTKEGRVPGIPNINYSPRDDYVIDILHYLEMLKELLSPDMMNNLDHKEVKQLLKMVKHFSVAAMLDIDVETVRKFAVKRDDLIISCSLRGSKENCNVTNDFNFWLDPLYGICYTYVHPSPVVEPGPRNGLSLILNTRAGKNVFFPSGSTADPVTGSSGVHITIHQPRTMPVPQVDRIDLPPGMSTSVGLKVHQRERITNCENKVQIVENVSYRVPLSQCQSLCKQEQFLKRCGCHDPFSFRMKNTRHCASLSFGNEVKTLCHNDSHIDKSICTKALKKWGARIASPYESLADPFFQETLQKSCRCEPLCSDVDYQWQTSYMKWPTDEAMVGYTGKDYNWESSSGSRRAQGGIPTPRPAKNSHIKDGHRMRRLIFHLSWPHPLSEFSRSATAKWSGTCDQAAPMQGYNVKFSRYFSQLFTYFNI